LKFQSDFTGSSKSEIWICRGEEKGQRRWPNQKGQNGIKGVFTMRVIALTAFFLASSALYPAFAQDNPKPSAGVQQKDVGQSEPDNRVIGKDWKLKPGDKQTVGQSRGASPDSANHYNQKIDRNWRAEPRSDEKGQ
jgi:hypothetical protein